MGRLDAVVGFVYFIPLNYFVDGTKKNITKHLLEIQQKPLGILSIALLEHVLLFLLWHVKISSEKKAFSEQVFHQTMFLIYLLFFFPEFP